MSALHLSTEPDDDERLDPLTMAERTIAAQVGTIVHLQNVVMDCVLRLHELGDHVNADRAEKLAQSGF